LWSLLAIGYHGDINTNCYFNNFNEISDNCTQLMFIHHKFVGIIGIFVILIIYLNIKLKLKLF
jgi:hypothetical protein